MFLPLHIFRLRYCMNSGNQTKFPLAIVVWKPWVTDQRWKIQEDVLYGILPKNTVPTRVTHCAFIALQKFYSDHCLKYFCEFPNNISFSFLLQKNKPTQSATIVLTLWIYRREDKLQSCILFWRDSKKGACTVINRLLARSVDIVAWPVQWRFAFCTSWKVSEANQRSWRNNK